LLTIRCGVAQDKDGTPGDCDWAVLQSFANPAFSDGELLQSLAQANAVHVFASLTAFNFFLKIWNRCDAAERKKLSGREMTACGVGHSTDTAARTLQQSGTTLNWHVPQFGEGDARENGLHWTLEQLEKRGLIPKNELHLWSKTDATSAKILRDVKRIRLWNDWQIHTHEIYSLGINLKSMPTEAIDALEKDSPVCFGVKSAEVLDATVAALLKHTMRNSISQLPRSIHFSVWERGALQRAQQLYMQPRLLPWSEFESLLPTAAK
jgi:hypothetical protein